MNNIKVFDNIRPEVKSVISVFIDSNYGTAKDYKGKEKIIEEALIRSNIISAYKGDELIGFIRYLTDFFYITHIVEFAIKKQYQNIDLSKEMLKLLCKEVGKTKISINTDAKLITFLEQNGFVKNNYICMNFN